VVAKAKGDNDPNLKAISDSRQACQKRLAEQLHIDANVPFGSCGLEEVKQFQKHLSQFQINVVSKDLFNAVLYSGPESEKLIYLYHHDNHYDVITSMAAFLNRKNFCPKCNKGYDHHEDHKCKYLCTVCFRGPCEVENWVYCADCNRYFKNDNCFRNHKEIN